MVDADYEVEPWLYCELWVWVAQDLEAKWDLILALVTRDDAFEYAREHLCSWI